MKKVEIVIPVRNEAEFLEDMIKKLNDFLISKNFNFDYIIHIVERATPKTILLMLQKK